MRFLLVALSLTIAFSAFGQEIAVTERGDSVMLNANGTWDYLSNLSGEVDNIVIEENSKRFKKPSESKAEAKGLGDAYRIY